MSSIFDLCPTAPAWHLDWPAVDAELPWIRNLRGCPQNPKYHAEGDVWVHTRMVCEALVAIPSWRALDAETRQDLFAAALLHDAAKPLCTKVMADGRVTSRGHARRGELLARQVLWRQAVPIARRERICALVRHHMVPLYLRDSEHRRRQVLAVSQVVRCDLLGLLGQADAAGRISTDADDLKDRHRAFEQLCRQMGCFDQPYPFPSDHSRFCYFHQGEGEPPSQARDAPGPEVVLMSGLPGTGKSEWVRRWGRQREILCLDSLRQEAGIGLFDNQGAVVAAARARARHLLGRGRELVWLDLNLARSTRGHLTGLFAEHGARVRVVYAERPADELIGRLGSFGIDDAGVAHLLERWEVPDLTEAHAVDYLAAG